MVNKRWIILCVVLIALLTVAAIQAASPPDDPSPPTTPVKLVFIHHSCGENWLNDSDGGLGIALRDDNYFVSDTNYGWGPDGIGSNTDIGHWWDWFRGASSITYTQALYTEYGQNSSYSRLGADPGGENEIVMFKSCYPNSNLGGSLGDTIPPINSNPLRGKSSGSTHHTVPNAQGIYIDLLEYFSTHPDKLFVAITAPPRIEGNTTVAEATNARDFNNWLVADDGWLNGYTGDNVAVFDFFNVLTSNGGDSNTNDLNWATGNHHRWLTDTVQHTQTVSSNCGAYGDDHPNSTGNQKATAEFVPLLNVFYNRWKSGSTPCDPITGVGISGHTSGYTDTLYSFTAVVTPPDASTPITYTWSPPPSSGSDAVANYTWPTTGTKTITVTAENCGGTTFTDTHTITIQAREQHNIYLPLILRNYAPCRRLTGVTINGPTSGTLIAHTFTADVTPSNATSPITYDWSPEPNSGQGTSSVSYHWATTGTKTITLTATNCMPPSAVAVSDTHTITISGAGADLVQPDDLTYLGAFRLPDREAGAPDEESWEYGGLALTYRPDGDAGGAGDGHPGSLFGAGYDVYNYISEISIPAPITSTNLEDLNFATTIQGFQDVRDGLFDALVEMPRVGLQYLSAQTGQTSAKLHLAWGAHHQDEGSPSQTPSHAWCDLTLSAPNTQGAWWIGATTVERLYRVNDYIFEIPSAWADTHLGGAKLATGRYRDGGWSGMGPNIFAYGPWLDGSPPISGTLLTAHELLAYSYAGGDHKLDYYHDSDDWAGGAWLTAGAKSAIVFVGTKGGGDYWWYGYASPAGDGVPCIWFPDNPEEGEPSCFRSSDGSSCVADFPTCVGYDEATKGWWSSRADAQMIFYDPADFAAVQNSTMQPYEPQPYDRLDIDEHLFLDWQPDTEAMCGAGDQRKCRIGAVAFDRDNGFLYVLELFADEAKPVVHVWEVQ